MSVSWTTIRDNAIVFQDRWKNSSGNERAEAQVFLYELLRDVYGVDPRRVGTFEKKVHPTSDTNGYIDMLWPGRILIEMKSRGKSLDKAHEQARKYAFSIKSDEDLPEYIMVCDFDNIRLYNLITNQQVEFKTSELADNVQRLSILTDRATELDLVVDKELNTQAAYKMAKLHDKLKDNRYDGHDLEVYLVRILFCLFADHTGIFAKRQFYKYVLDSKSDGSDLAGRITTLFEVLNTSKSERMPNLAEELSSFPYVNGGLFREYLRSASFDSEMYDLLVECCEFDWSTISPAIFGAMFQTVMDPEKRVSLGEQYTPQHIIKKVLKPLFIDDLYKEFELCKCNAVSLQKFHLKLASLNFLDPACGCGNFLIVAYGLLRKLELEVIRELYPTNNSLPSDFDLDQMVKVNVNQFYGIEIEEFPCQIAQAGMWIIDHKMNMEAANEFGKPFIRIPLTAHANICQKNALTSDWNDVVSNTELNYIFGNPPYYGGKKRTKEQRKEMQAVFKGCQSAGLLDYVAAWYMCAAKYIDGTKIKVGFVSTSSITQGEQVAVLWKPMFERHNIQLLFGYKPFKWTNEARDVAMVRCVIIGFHSGVNEADKCIYCADGTVEYTPILNPYLDGIPEITLIGRRGAPISNVLEISTGNKPIDNGNYLFSEKEKNEFIEREPSSKDYFHPWYGSDEFLKKTPRYCLLVKDCPPDLLATMPLVQDRIEKVKQFRKHSSDAGTRKLGDHPKKFHITNIPTVRYLLIPEVSSETRDYIPMGFMSPDKLASNLTKLMPNATLYHFGILTSKVHMVWTRAIGGRLEERYRYSIEIIYNNFPWPTITPKQKERVEALAQNILDVRAKYENISFKKLYKSVVMPDDLLEAHQKLDKYVAKLYGLRADFSDRECLLELLRRYNEVVSNKDE